MFAFSSSLIGAPLLLLAMAPLGHTQGVPSPQPVDLGAAGNYVILAKTAISTVPSSNILGDLGLSPAAATFITGFALSADATNVFSTSTQVTGKVFAADYAVPTPSNLTTAVTNMETAYTDAAGRAPNYTELGAGNVGGLTLTRGVYKWGTGLLIPTDLTLSGTADDVFIFQIAQNLTMSSAMKIHLIGGATARNIFWQVAGDVAIGTTAHFEGVILCQTAITLGTGATINGDLYAQTAVHLDSNGVAKASPAGTSVYGTGTPGCSGILWMNANVPPRINTLDFAILCSNVPTSSLGLGLVTDSQDLEGSFLFGWGILIHIDLIGSTQVLSYDMTSSSNGVGYSPIPIPNNPALIGNTYYTQCFWLQKPGDDCSHSPLNLVSSNGLAITIQP